MVCSVQKLVVRPNTVHSRLRKRWQSQRNVARGELAARPVSPRPGTDLHRPFFFSLPISRFLPNPPCAAIISFGYCIVVNFMFRFANEVIVFTKICQL